MELAGGHDGCRRRVLVRPIPLTSALGMTEEPWRREKSQGAGCIRAAASNLGQMLNKVCIKDGIGLVNIVRSKEQADIPAQDRRTNTSVDSTRSQLHG